MKKELAAHNLKRLRSTLVSSRMLVGAVRQEVDDILAEAIAALEEKPLAEGWLFEMQYEQGNLRRALFATYKPPSLHKLPVTITERHE